MAKGNCTSAKRANAQSSSGVDRSPYGCLGRLHKRSPILHAKGMGKRGEYSKRAIASVYCEGCQSLASDVPERCEPTAKKGCASSVARPANVGGQRTFARFCVGLAQAACRRRINGLRGR